MNASTDKKLSVVTIGLLVGLGAAAGLAAGAGPVFSHKAHLEEGAECDTCHKSTEGNEFPTVQTSGCEDCHDDGAPAYSPPPMAKRLPFSFPHKLHEDVGECADCHAAVAKDHAKAGTTMIDYAGCGACHEENDVQVPEANCKSCHGVDQRKKAPSDHAHAWLKKHGRESRWRVFADHGQDCGLCHRADGCQTCHKTQRPGNHTGLWRTRTHGVAAGWDRQACQTCHETGACIRCHRSTAPLNHRGAWRSTHGLAAQSRSNEHCTVCHQASWCAACHRGR